MIGLRRFDIVVADRNAIPRCGQKVFADDRF
jgi:hypothetical protein